MILIFLFSPSVITQETKQVTQSPDMEPVCKISHSFANSVTKDCFQSLIVLLRWSWGMLKMALNDLKDKVCLLFFTQDVYQFH